MSIRWEEEGVGSKWDGGRTGASRKGNQGGSRTGRSMGQTWRATTEGRRPEGSRHVTGKPGGKPGGKPCRRRLGGRAEDGGGILEEGRSGEGRQRLGAARGATGAGLAAPAGSPPAGYGRIRRRRGRPAALIL